MQSSGCGAVDSEPFWIPDRFTLPAVHPDFTSLPERPDPPVWVSTQAIPWFSLTAEASTPWHWREFMVRFRMHSSPGERIHHRGTAGTRLHSSRKSVLHTTHFSSVIKANYLKSDLKMYYIHKTFGATVCLIYLSSTLIHHCLSFFLCAVTASLQESKKVSMTGNAALVLFWFLWWLWRAKFILPDKTHSETHTTHLRELNAAHSQEHTHTHTHFLLYRADHFCCMTSSQTASQ